MADNTVPPDAPLPSPSPAADQTPAAVPLPAGSPDADAAPAAFDPDSAALRLTTPQGPAIVEASAGGFSPDDLRTAADAINNSAPAMKPPPLPAAADVTGDPWTPDPQRTGGQQTTILPLPVDAVTASGLRPDRILFRDGTKVEAWHTTPNGTRETVEGTTAGIRRDGSGWLQQVDTGTQIIPVHPSAVHPADISPYAGLDPVQAVRAVRFDEAEEAGREDALLSASHVTPDDVIMPPFPGDDPATWTVTANEAAENTAGRKITVKPTREGTADRLWHLGDAAAAHDDCLTFLVRDDTQMFVRIPEKHPAQDTAAGSMLFAACLNDISPEQEPARILSTLADMLAGTRTALQRRDSTGALQYADAAARCLTVHLDALARDWAPDPWQGKNPGPPGDPAAWQLEIAAALRAAAAGEDASQYLPQHDSQTIQALTGLMTAAAGLAGDAADGNLSVPPDGLNAWRQLMTAICEIAAALAFRAARALPEGTARAAAERLGERACEYIAHAERYLDPKTRLAPGSYTAPEGFRGSARLRADIAAQLAQEGVRLADVSADGARRLGLTPVRRPRVPVSRVGAAVRTAKGPSA